jgi:hypothetical protein
MKHSVLNNIFSLKIVSFEIYCGNSGTAGQSADDNSVRALCMLYSCSRKKTHTHNIQYLLLFHANNRYAKVILTWPVLFLSPPHPNQLYGSTSLLANGYGGLFWGRAAVH